MSERVIRFLQRPGAHETWVYERRVILLIEAVCLLAGILAAPNRTASLLLLLDAPRSLYATELARAARSAAARKAERAAAMNIPKVQLACERDIERAAKRQQFMTAASPVVALGLSVAGSGGQGLTLAAVVGFCVSLVRWAAVEDYSKWRAWYRERVPVRDCKVEAATSPFNSAAIAQAVEAVNAAVRNTRGEQ